MTGHRLGRLLLLHGVLLALACVFLFPFVWMLLVSAKTDEEAAANRFPAMPTFRASSPYVSADGKTVSLELLGMEVRTRDLRIIKLPIDSASTQVTYDFSKSREPLTIRLPATFPMPVEQIHKFALSLKPDDSWHRLEVELHDGTAVWRSVRPFYLAQQRPTTVLFQPPGPDDESLRAKTWIRLSRVESEAQTNSEPYVLVRILPSSTSQAIYGKLTRNFDRVFRFVPFWTYVGNSVFVAALSVAGMLFSSTFVAYAFARLNWPGRSIAMGILLATMMLPPQVTLVPSFVVIKTLGWYNTLSPMWVPSFLGSAFFIFLMVQHLRTIPRELEEAAKLDGLGHVQTWYYIMLPQVKPAAAAIAILTFQAAWNDFLGPLIYLRDQSLYTLSLGLYDLQLYSANDQSVIMAGNVLMTLPVIVIFFLFQRYFVAGVTMSGLKG